MNACQVRWSLGGEGGVTVHAQLLHVAHVDEMLNCAIVVDVDLCDWIAVVEEDAALALADFQNLTVDHDVAAALPGHVFELELVTGDPVACSFVGQVLGEGAEEVEWLAGGEELCVAELEEFSVLADLEPLTALNQLVQCRPGLPGHGAATVSDRFVLAGMDGDLGTFPCFLLALTVSPGLSVYNILAAHEVGSPALCINDGALHPWVLEDVLDRRSLLRVESDHALEEIFEFWRENVSLLLLRLGMQSPERVELAGGQQAEKVVTALGCVEWWPLSQRCEQNDAGCEDVDAGSFIAQPQMHLWRHIRHCADLGLEHARVITASDGR